MTADLFTDSVLSAASLAGLWALARTLRDADDEPAARRLIWSVRLLAAFMLCRILFWSTGGALSGGILFATAAFLPLAATLVVEALIRRHAPLGLKLWVAFGSLFLALAPLVPWGQNAIWPLSGLAVFQLISFGTLTSLLVRRDVSDLSASQNTVVRRFLFAFLALLPLLITDFRGFVVDSPARLASLAVLIFCLLAIDARRGADRLRVPLTMIAVTALSTGVSTALIPAIIEIEWRALIQVGLIFFAIALSAQTVISAFELKRRDLHSRLVQLLADGPKGNQISRASFAAEIANAIGRGAAAAISRDNLQDFDEAFMGRVQDVGVLKKAENHQDDWMNEQSAWFFKRFDATHVLWVGDADILMLAINLPTLAKSDAFELELSAVQRFMVHAYD